MKVGKGYLEKLARRRKESRVYRNFQLDGLEISQILHDESHKSLYIKLAKEGNAKELRRAAREIAEHKNIKNKGAYFMWYITRHKDQFTRHGTEHRHHRRKAE